MAAPNVDRRPAVRTGFLPIAITAVFAALMLAACTRTPVKETFEWPGGLPPLGYYERVYEQDQDNRSVQTREEYLTWVVRFYKGWKLYQDGWEATTRDILLSIDHESARKRLNRKLARLGKLISAEWAKETDDRLIHSRELSIWGQVLLESINRSEEEKLVDEIGRDVKVLLAGRLDRTEINLERY